MNDMKKFFHRAGYKLELFHSEDLCYEQNARTFRSFAMATELSDLYAYKFITKLIKIFCNYIFCNTFFSKFIYINIFSLLKYIQYQGACYQIGYRQKFQPTLKETKIFFLVIWIKAEQLNVNNKIYYRRKLNNTRRNKMISLNCCINSGNMPTSSFKSEKILEKIRFVYGK